MDPDAIAALVAAAREGKLPEEGAATETKRDNPRARRVDFRRPRQFTGDQQRRLRRGLETFCRASSSRLSGTMRTAVDVELINIDQLTWSDAHDQIPSTSLAAVLRGGAPKMRLLLAAELQLVLTVIELQLGGVGGRVPERRLSEIDVALGTELIDSFTEQLSVVWEELVALPLAVDQVTNHQQTAQMAPTSEPTLSVTFEVRLAGASTALILLVPYRSIAPVAELLGGTPQDSDPEVEAHNAEVMRSAMRRVQMEVRAEVGSVELSLDAVLALRPGQLIDLGVPADSGVTLLADEAPLENAMPGRSGRRRAVQIMARTQEADR